jgi:hypothetical protein
LTGWRGRPECVTEQFQAELYDLVRATAGRVGIPMPDRVRLVGTAEVSGHGGGRRRDLLVGLPLLDALSPAELSALIAHELSVSRQPHPCLTGHLLAICREAQDRNTFRAQDGLAPKRRDVALLAATARWYAAVEQAADEAAVMATDAQTAARALALGRVVADEFAAFLNGSSAALLAMRGYAVDDLAAGWRLGLTAGVDGADTSWDEDCAAHLAARHPGAGTRLAALGTQPIGLTLPVHAVAVEPLARRQRRRLVRQALQLRASAYLWRTFQQMPDRYWRKDIATNGKQIRTAALATLNTDDASPTMIADAILRRPTEVTTAYLAGFRKLYDRLGITPDVPDGVDPAPLLASFIEATLYERGWRREHPLIEGVLTAPGEQRVDARDLAARATGDAFARAELHRLLTPQ